jgi:hypothetical protein
MEQLPVRQQFILMQFRPCLDQTPLFLRKRSGDQVHGANRENGGFVLKIGMEMSNVMRCPGSENMRMTMPKKRLTSGTELL